MREKARQRGRPSYEWLIGSCSGRIGWLGNAMKPLLSDQVPGHQQGNHITPSRRHGILRFRIDARFFIAADFPRSDSSSVEYRSSQEWTLPLQILHGR